MKKHLLIALTMCIGLTSLAAPWDLRTSHKKFDVAKPFGKAMFDDPFFIERDIDEAYVGSQRMLHVYVKFDHSVNYALQYEFGHAGDWVDPWPDWTRVFTITYPPNTLQKHTYFPLQPGDNPTWGLYNEYYLGPVLP